MERAGREVWSVLLCAIKRLCWPSCYHEGEDKDEEEEG